MAMAANYPDFPAERAALAARWPELVQQHEGHYVVVLGSEVLGCRLDFDDALDLGYEHAGGPNFFVELLLRQAPVQVMPFRLVNP